MGLNAGIISTEFHGSYAPEDVCFLLKPIQIEETDILTKETLIQTGQKHYSEMISKEYVPSIEYLDIFYQAMAMNKEKMAANLLYLAGLLARRQEPPVIVSLARAGTPVGVILKRILKERFDLEVSHYSISIIRDKGIDENALRFIIENHADTAVVFVDGWTGKGVIGNELKYWGECFNQRYGTAISTDLYVLSDISGTAEFCATTEDYLIPSAILNATVSGLISRSILNAELIGPNDFHGCVFYEGLQEADLSRWFVKQMMASVADLSPTPNREMFFIEPDRQKLRVISLDFINKLQQKLGVRSINHIKPGIGETTRVLLRRQPDRILLRDPNLPEVKHLLQLANEKNVPVIVDCKMPYKATGIIRQQSH